MTRNTHLLIIDPQNDFSDLPDAWLAIDPVIGEPHRPSLPVNGAHRDLLRVAGFIDAVGADLSDISITLDTHHRLDIAHPGFWLTDAGVPPEPFTQITVSDVRSGRFVPRDHSGTERVLAYVDALEARNRYTLMVWPVHCELGTWGHGVHEAVRGAYNRWELATARTVGKLIKGMNRWTENYSVFEAEVPDPDDPTTQLNHALLARLDAADRIVVCGEASSHCVASSVAHLMEHLPGGRLDRITILTDAMSPVAGFQEQHDALLRTLEHNGVQLSTTVELARELTGVA